jgi:hypothetical protein
MKQVKTGTKGRTYVVVGVFANPAALLKLASAVLVEQHNEWEVSTADAVQLRLTRSAPAMRVLFGKHQP